MALVNPNIALSVKPLEFQMPNALAQAAQLMQLQKGQAELGEYESAAAERNRLRQLNPTAPDYETQLFRVNPQLGIAYRKERTAAESNEATRQKALTEATAARQGLLAQAKRDISQRPSDANIMSYLEDIESSPLFNDAEKAQTRKNSEMLLSMPFDQRGPYLASQGAKAGDLKPHINVQGTGATTRLLSTPAFGGQTSVVPGSEAKITMSPYEAARIGQENQRLAQEATGVVYQEDANGNIVALPSKLKKGEVPTARVAVAPGGGFQPLVAKPSEAVGKEQMSINQQKAIIKGALDAVAATPDAFGWTTGNLPEAIRARAATPAENEARSYLFNVVSGVIKERAGTAQSAAEAETLRRFLPVETDNADIIKDKMTAFDKYLTAKEAGTTKKRGGAMAEKPSLSPMDQEALKWANSNPGDPRASQIKQRLGM